MTRTESFAGFARGVSPAVGRISGHVDGVEVEYKGGGFHLGNYTRTYEKCFEKISRMTLL